MKAIALIVFTFMVWSAISCTGSKKNEDQQGERVVEQLSKDSLLTLVQYNTFQYFWEGAEPVSGMARERFHVDGDYPQNDKNVISTGGSGFGIMAIIIGIERRFITREEGLNRIFLIVDFLKRADRYHGAWSHWIQGETGKTKPFNQWDNGADIVETAFLMQGLLTARQYFANGSEREKLLVGEIDKLWREVEWSWFTNGGEDVLYRHWSPDFGWQINQKVEGWNESLMLFILAAASPTFPVNPSTYQNGWARSGGIVSDKKVYDLPLLLNHNHDNEFGGPLFWSHYSFLGLNPRNLEDKYAKYWDVNVNHTLINRMWCIKNQNGFEGYGDNCWGLTSSYSPIGYAAHSPGPNTDLGVISPTAALSSFPYTPVYSMEALNHFYYNFGEKIFGKYGFYDAFSVHDNWFPQMYLAIDQGPIIIMIENHRTGLCWNLFMSAPEVQKGLNTLGFTY